MEIKYRKMMEDNNVEKVLAISVTLHTAASLLFLSRSLYGLIFVVHSWPDYFLMWRSGSVVVDASDFQSFGR